MTAEPIAGFAGDTVASALLAYGVRVVGRSFKYHRPRGILTAGSEEPNALLELREGARREAEHSSHCGRAFRRAAGTQPESLAVAWRLIVGAINSWSSPSVCGRLLLQDIHVACRLLGEVLRAADPARRGTWPRSASSPIRIAMRKRTAFCDVLVIGGGPAGLTAAVTAGRSGARVILCDEDFLIGGRLIGERREIDGTSAPIGQPRPRPNSTSMPDVRIMRRTTVFGATTTTYGAVERVSDHLPVPPAGYPRQRLWRIAAKQIVLASGGHREAAGVWWQRPARCDAGSRP